MCSLLSILSSYHTGPEKHMWYQKIYLRDILTQNQTLQEIDYMAKDDLFLYFYCNYAPRKLVTSNLKSYYAKPEICGTTKCSPCNILTQYKTTLEYKAKSLFVSYFNCNYALRKLVTSKLSSYYTKPERCGTTKFSSSIF